MPIRYGADRAHAEQILIEAAERHGVPVSELSADALVELQRRYFLKATDVRSRVYFRLTDNWLELIVRFVVREHGIREQKDAISRDVLASFERAGIAIASATFEVVSMPPVRLVNGSALVGDRAAG